MGLSQRLGRPGRARSSSSSLRAPTGCADGHHQRCRGHRGNRTVSGPPRPAHRSARRGRPPERRVCRSGRPCPAAGPTSMWRPGTDQRRPCIWTQATGRSREGDRAADGRRPAQATASGTRLGGPVPSATAADPRALRRRHGSNRRWDSSPADLRPPQRARTADARVDLVGAPGARLVDRRPVRRRLRLLRRGRGALVGHRRRDPDRQPRLLRRLALLHHGRPPAVRPGGGGGRPGADGARPGSAGSSSSSPTGSTGWPPSSRASGTLFFNVSTGHALVGRLHRRTSAPTTASGGPTPSAPSASWCPATCPTPRCATAPPGGSRRPLLVDHRRQPGRLGGLRCVRRRLEGAQRRASCAVRRGPRSAPSSAACASSGRRSCCCPSGPPARPHPRPEPRRPRRDRAPGPRAGPRHGPSSKPPAVPAEQAGGLLHGPPGPGDPLLLGHQAGSGSPPARTASVLRRSRSRAASARSSAIDPSRSASSSRSGTVSDRDDLDLDDLQVAFGVAGAQHLLVELADAGLRDLVDDRPPLGEPPPGTRSDRNTRGRRARRPTLPPAPPRPAGVRSIARRAWRSPRPRPRRGGPSPRSPARPTRSTRPRT